MADWPPNTATTLSTIKAINANGAGGTIQFYSSSLTNTGMLQASDGGTISVQSTWTNRGTILAQNGGTITATTPTNYTSGTLTSGTWQVFANSTLRLTLPSGIITNAATILLDGANSNFYEGATGTTNALANLNANSGSFTIQNGRNFTTAVNLNDSGQVQVGPSSTLTVTGQYTEAGACTVQAGGTFTIAGALANFDGANLNGGSFDLLGTLQFPGANIQGNAAALVLDGAGAQILDQNGNNGLANFALNAVSGSLTLQNGANLTTAGNFENDGSLTIGPGSTLTITGVDTDTGTLTLLASGTLNLLGGGSSSGTISNAGTLTLAAGAGFTSTGSYSQSGTLLIADTALFSLLGSFSNFDGANLSGGTYDILGTFQFNNAAIVTNAATLILDGPDAMVLDQNGNPGLAGTLTTNAVGANLTLRNGANLTTAGAFENDGNLTVGAGSALVVTGADTDTGTLTILAGGSVEFQNGGSSSGTLSNADTLLIDAGTVFTSSGSYSQSGTVVVADTGTLSLLGTFSNFAGGTLTGGTYDLFGTFQFTNAAVVTNAATLTLDGPDALLMDQNGNNGLASSLVANANGASLTIQNGATLTTPGAFSNAGTLTIGAGSSLTVSGAYTQTGTLTILNTGLLTLLGGGSSNASITNAGTLDVAGGSFTVTAAWALTGTVSIEVGATLGLAAGSSNSGSLNVLGTLTAAGNFSNSGNISLSGAFTIMAGGSYTQLTGGTTTLSGGSLTAATVNLQGGILAGSGTITGNVTNAAEIDVGGIGAIGQLAIVGNYTQTAAGVLNLEVGGYGAGVGFDQLTVSGTATLGGTMNVSLINGFVPMSGDAFALLTFASATGTFAGGTIDPAFMAPQYDPMDVMLVAR